MKLKQLYYFFSNRYQNLFSDYKVNLKPRYGHGNKPHKELFAIIDSYRENYEQLIEKILYFEDNLKDIRKADSEQDCQKPTWNNGFLPGLDIASIYTILASYKPNTYIEVGSGNSTKVAYKAKEEQNLKTEIISIDPMPRAEIDQLANEIIREPFENVDLQKILELKENDVLFIDNSHRILPNSDSMVFFLEVLPKLKPGVIVHIHDVYLPYDYPQFMCDRFYSEQYGLAMYLLANSAKYEPMFPCYFVSEDKFLSEKLSPLWKQENMKGIEQHGCSFWLKIRS